MTAEKTTLKCAQCNKEFKYDSERRRHEKSHAPQFKCKVCCKTFSFISALRRHEKQHERTGNVTCDLCDKKFRDQMLLKRHVKYAHGGSYTCIKCYSVFNSEPALRTHMRTHKAESERRYQCSFEGCSKKFNFAHHLKHHELTHTNTKQYFCKICGKGFIQSHHLKTHLKTHSADFSLYCTFPDCNKKFTTEYAKKRHVAKCHIKTDSGISSDSNCTCDASIPSVLKETSINDDIESPFAEMMLKTKNEGLMFIDSEKFMKNTPEDLSINKSVNKENSAGSNDGYELNGCTLAVGSCIMHDQGETCVCAQINETINEDYDFTPIETDVINIDKLSLNTNDCEATKCCGGHGGDRPNNEKPEIEYRIDGTVKIKEFLDLDYPALDLGQRKDSIKNNANFIPYNSCKAVLGKCIVSGSGTIGDECLCAKMIIDEQVTAEEIDDITPHPK